MGKKILLVAFLLLVASLMLAQAVPVTYYVDSVGGNDGNSGTSTSAAWRTLARAATQVYGAGDQLLLKRGCVWQEAAFKPTSSGAAGAPIVMADYGTGNLPKIIGNADCAIILNNVSYWTLRNLDLAQVGLAPLAINAEKGKDQDQYSDTWAKAVLEIRGLNNGITAHIRVENCKVHDGHWNGIYVSGGLYQLDSNNKGHADDIVVTGCEAYNNQKSGMDATCTYEKSLIYTATNIQVLNSTFHDNGADGVVLGPVSNGLIDHCLAYNCGLTRNARLGLWCWDSVNVIIQFSESRNNVAPFYTSQTRDGGGFDLDLGSIDCVVQYCYSHDNTGEGYLLMTWPIGYGFPRGDSIRQTMRYCISEHDATKNSGSISVFGGADCWMYNNVLYYIPERSAGSVMFEGEGGCLTSSKWGKSGAPVMRTYNNIFICDKTRSVNQSAVSYLVRHTAGTLTSDYNSYYRVEGGVLFNNGADITTFSAWQAAGYDAHGMNVNPMVVNMGGGSAASYMLQAGSPCINAGTNVTGAPRGMGSQDYFGNAIPNGAFDIGVHEVGGAAPSPSPSAPPPSPSPSPSAPPPSPSAPPASPSPSPSAPPPSPSPSANLALGKTTAVSSYNATTLMGDKAVDGNATTYWRSKKRSQLSAEWIVVDLGASYSIDTVTLNWNAQYATAYEIQTSPDNNAWTTRFSTATGNGGTDNIAFGAVSARYVRMNSTAWYNGTERCWLNEFEIYQ